VKCFLLQSTNCFVFSFGEVNWSWYRCRYHRWNMMIRWLHTLIASRLQQQYFECGESAKICKDLIINNCMQPVCIWLFSMSKMGHDVTEGAWCNSIKSCVWAVAIWLVQYKSSAISPLWLLCFYWWHENCL